MTKREEIEEVDGMIDALENALGDLTITSSDLARYGNGMVNVQRGFEKLRPSLEIVSQF